MREREITLLLEDICFTLPRKVNIGKTKYVVCILWCEKGITLSILHQFLISKGSIGVAIGVCKYTDA